MCKMAPPFFENSNSFEQLYRKIQPKKLLWVRGGILFTKKFFARSYGVCKRSDREEKPFFRDSTLDENLSREGKIVVRIDENTRVLFFVPTIDFAQRNVFSWKISAQNDFFLLVMNDEIQTVDFAGVYPNRIAYGIAVDFIFTFEKTKNAFNISGLAFLKNIIRSANSREATDCQCGTKQTERCKNGCRFHKKVSF
ncbi:MAG: hypothetical protein Q4D38_10780 [Planctomycetia bacterium]|nr:hypothetical protein [Planctomycetia bacterium]